MNPPEALDESPRGHRMVPASAGLGVQRCWCRWPRWPEAPEQSWECRHGAGLGKRLVIAPVLQDSQRRGVSQQGQETRSSWQLVFVLAIPSPLRPGSSENIQEPCQGKLYLTCALPDCLHSSWARHSGQGCPSPHDWGVGNSDSQR